MLSQQLQILFVLVIGVCKFSDGFTCRSKTNQNSEFDTFLFVQQWPPTYCKIFEKGGKECREPPQKGVWTIHGIWPSRFNTKVDDQPSCCDSSIGMNADGLRPIKEQLQRYWPTVQKDRKDEEFWEYEWLKHGTCGVTTGRLDSSDKFFNQALQWQTQYNMESILARANIVPDNEKPYELKDIHGAVKRVLNKNPSIQCYYDNESGEQYLNEIRICFDQRLNLIDCDGIDRYTNKDKISTNCRNKPINYRGDFADQTTGWFTYVGYIGLLIFMVVMVILLKNTNLLQRFTQKR